MGQHVGTRIRSGMGPMNASQKIALGKLQRLLAPMLEPSEVIEDYVKRYNELLAASTFFRKGIFDYFNATQIAKALADNGFFTANHTVTLHAAGQKPRRMA